MIITGSREKAFAAGADIKEMKDLGMYVCMYLCIYVCSCILAIKSSSNWANLVFPKILFSLLTSKRWKDLGMYVCVFVCMYVCMYVCIYVSMYAHVYLQSKALPTELKVTFNFPFTNYTIGVMRFISFCIRL